jgi:hypothetical protein
MSDCPYQREALQSYDALQEEQANKFAESLTNSVSRSTLLEPLERRLSQR